MKENNRSLYLTKLVNPIDGLNKEVSFEEALKSYQELALDQRLMFVLKDCYSSDLNSQELLFNEEEKAEVSIKKIIDYSDYHPLRFYMTRLHDIKNNSTFSKIAVVTKYIFEDLNEKACYKVDSSFNKYTRKIAYLNINKEFWYKRSPNSHVKKAYEKYREILLSQIKTINPGVIIFGGTFSFFWKDLSEKYNIGLFKIDLSEYTNTKIKFACYVSKNNPKKFLLIETTHPMKWSSNIPSLINRAKNKWLLNQGNILDNWNVKDVYIGGTNKKQR